ncbi:MAG: hypothetical protein SWO11_19055 [Thermodesulfobacteriota bacterium]|nr:hypothetical protein [Thermodesulfobacteriota bacterium]
MVDVLIVFQGIHAQQILGDGTIQTEEELANKKNQNNKDYTQMSLFEPKEDE